MVGKWKPDKQFEEGYFYNKEDNHLQIREQTYGDGYQVDIWKSNPFKSVSTRKFKTYKQAFAYAKGYMRSH